VIIATTLAAAFIGGISVSVAALLGAGIAREERDHSMLGHPATQAARFSRRVVGLYVHTSTAPPAEALTAHSAS
jgi:hypothetical protein